MPALTRGPLPPSVYWRRRLVVVTVALLLLWGAVHVFGGGGGDNRPSAAADLTGSSTMSSPQPSTSAESTTPTPSVSTTPSISETPTPTPTVLPTPTGACAPSDLSVTPSVTGAAAGANVAIVLRLQTFSTPACTWHVGHKTMQVKVSTAGGADVWSTVQCPAALTNSDVVVYKDVPTQVSVTWSARPSDAECSTHTRWSSPGTYSVTGVALGGVPDQATFTLGPHVAAPPAAQPTSSASATPGTSPSSTSSSTPSSTATAKAGSTSATPSSSGTAPAKKKHKKQIQD